MGIDIYDALSGLGAGATSLGTSIDDQRKEKLKERLQKEEETRLEQRTIRAEQRQHDEEAKKTHEKVIRPDANGAYKEQRVNVFGDTIREQDANPLEVDAVLNANKMGKASLDKILADTEQTQIENRHLPGKYSQEERVNEAIIGEHNSHANYYDRPSPNTKTKDTSLITLTEDMADEMKAYQGELSPELFRTAVREALKAARIAHKDARQVLLDMLPDYKKKYEGK